MMTAMTEEAASMYARAQREPLMRPDTHAGTARNREQIERLLPHREPFLFLDAVESIDVDGGLLLARCELSRLEGIFAGHFPGDPVLPGVIQIEAVGQAGILLSIEQGAAAAAGKVALTDVLAARFIRPVEPVGHLGIGVALLEDGLFMTIVGQCIQHGVVCSVSVVRGLAIE